MTEPKRTPFFSLAILGLAGLISLFPGPAQAQDQKDSEADVLNLYFSEKELIEAPTRHPKYLSQIPENVSIITADDIEFMNAHTVSEVLNRAAGVLVFSHGLDFGSPASYYIQGSTAYQVLVLIDGVRWNSPGGGYPETNTIPVQIIKRIEIIRGPASSTWGSSLGGVINIITKDPPGRPGGGGSLYGTFGEHETREFRGELSATAGPIGCYAFAGTQDSDGLWGGRFFDNESGYGKIVYNRPGKLKFTLTSGASSPYYKEGDFWLLDYSAFTSDRQFFVTGNLDIPFSQDLGANLSAYTHKRRFDQRQEGMGLGTPYTPAGVLISQYIYEEKTVGGEGHIAWTPTNHAVVLGAEAYKESYERTGYFGPWLQQDYGYPASVETSPASQTISALYVNDTVRFGKFTLVPGIRYDRYSISGDSLSPSLGITRPLGNETLLRAVVSRGFRAPYLGIIEGEGVPGFAPNPALEPEKVWSYQVGIDTRTIPYILLKTSLFWHEISDSWLWAINKDGNYFMDNGADSQRRGFEIEGETMAIYDFSLVGNFSYTHSASDDSSDDHIERHMANLIVPLR